MVYEYEKMMNKYNDYMSNCSEEEINEEKKRLLSKLKRVKYVSENGKVIKKDITNDTEERNRIELRYKMTHNYNRMKRFFKFYHYMQFDKGMEILNKVFMDPIASVDHENPYLKNISSKRIDFINTLNYDGLEKYGLYLKNVFEAPMLMPKKLTVLAKEERKKIFKSKDDSLYSDCYLTNDNVEEYGTCICKLKVLNNLTKYNKDQDLEIMGK